MMQSHSIEYEQHKAIENHSLPTIGKRLVIMGNADAGPYYEPTRIQNKRVADDFFKNGALIQRYEDVQIVDDSIEVIFVRIHEDNFEMGYKSLQPYSFDLIYIDNFQLSDSDDKLDAFIDFAEDKESQGNLIHGFFDLDVNSDRESIRHKIGSLSFDDMFETYELGKHFSIVSDQFYGHRAGAVYAALVASLEPGVSPINKTLNVFLKKKWKKDEGISFYQDGIVTFRESIKNGVVCSHATCAVQTPGSVHKNISNYRIAQYMIQELSNALQESIGTLLRDTQIESIQEIVENKIREYISLERIRTGEYSLSIDREKGNVYILLDIVPIFTTKYIRSHAQVRIF